MHPYPSSPLSFCIQMEELSLPSQTSPRSIFIIYFSPKYCLTSQLTQLSDESVEVFWLKVRWVRLLLCLRKTLTPPLPLTQSLFCLLVDRFQSLNLETGWLRWNLRDICNSAPGLAVFQRWSQLLREKPRGFARPSPTFSQWSKLRMPFTLDKEVGRLTSQCW